MRRTVHVHVFDGHADWELGFAMAGIANPQFQREPGSWQLRTVAAHTRSAVRSMGGLTILPDMCLEELHAADSAMLILPGGDGWEEPGAHRAAVEKAAAFLRHGTPVAAICGATAGLARAGLLDDRAHTSNAPSYMKGSVQCVLPLGFSAAPGAWNATCAG